MVVENISDQDQELIDAIVGTCNAAAEDPEVLRPYVGDIIALCELLISRDPRLSEFVGKLRALANQRALQHWSGGTTQITDSPWSSLADGLAMVGP